MLPLNPDALTYIMVDLAQTGSVLGGLLDAQGRRTVPLSVPPGLFLQQRGSQLDFAFLTLVPIDFTSNPATLQLR